MRISFLFQLTTAAFCGALFTACGTPPTSNETSSSSSASGGSGGEASTSSSSSASTGGMGGMGGIGGAGGASVGGMGGAGGGNTDFNFSATVSVPNVPADSKVVVVWSVSAASPDYLYKWGDGQTDGKTFMVTLMGDPPPDAINAGFVGVGVIVVVPSNYVVPEGKLTSTQSNDLQAKLLAFSAQHAIIFHPNASQSPYPWSSQFANGYECAKCVPMPASFDEWAPTKCSDITLVDINQPVCNWT